MTSEESVDWWGLLEESEISLNETFRNTSGLPPPGTYALTGEFREPRNGENYLHVHGSRLEVMPRVWATTPASPSSRPDFGKERPIVRRVS